MSIMKMTASRFRANLDRVLDEVIEKGTVVHIRRRGRTIRSIVAAASGLTWTRDPFDRLIVGHAQADEATLLTADRSIRQHCRFARWG